MRVRVYLHLCGCLCVCVPLWAQCFEKFWRSKTFSVRLQNVVYEQSVPVDQHFLNVFLVAVYRGCWLKVVWPSCSIPRINFYLALASCSWGGISQSVFLLDKIGFCISSASSACQKLHAGNARLLLKLFTYSAFAQEQVTRTRKQCKKVNWYSCCFQQSFTLVRDYFGQAVELTVHYTGA